MKVLSVVGNRPQFIKSAPLSLALRDAGIDEIVLHTGQHYDAELSQVFFDELALAEPAYRLDLHSADPETMRPRIADAVERERPDWVLVYGDTNTTLAGAEAAIDAGVRVAHVEAGLRSGDLSMPEERNRIEVDRLSQLLFAPDERSRETLVREHAPGRIEVAGDVMRDALDLFAPIARARSQVVERFGVEPGRYLVCTIHREANVRPERLARIVAGLNALDEPIVFPAHPRTAAIISGFGPHVQLVAPLGYLDFTSLVSQARVVLTDSGGLQKEAYWHGVPCVTLRPSTEWIDTVAVGANVLVDDDPVALVAAVDAAHMPVTRPQLYGDGHASGRIAAALYAWPPE
ncbi:MAG: non-hydrolyzing UDP-N-acetylglucosamine 2-epimerase [Gaiellaceae bacterium]